MKTSHNWLNLIRLWIDCNNGKMTVSSNKIYTSQRRSKFTFAFSLVEPSKTIFISNVLYLAITRWAKHNIDIQRVFTFFKILAPFVSISFASFVNSKCFFRAFRKLILQGLKQTFSSTHHLQMKHSLNYKVGSMSHTMHPHGMWSPTINNLLCNTWLGALENKNLIHIKGHEHFTNQIFCETSFMH